jgi:tRNA nucleotidyltransferase/poly(A) polymerase
MTRVTGEWLANPATQAVFDMLERGGFQAWAVGGCVRNALLDQPVTDVDIATDAAPSR